MMVKDWDQLAETWEDDASNIEFTNKAYAELTRASGLENKHVLDLGCGTGLLSQLISLDAKSIVALDASEAMIEELDRKALKNVEPVVDSLTRGLVAQHPAFRKQFDLILAASVCSFLPRLDECLEIAHSLLNKGGQFIHWDWIIDDEDRSSGLGMVEMQDKLILAGFGHVRVRRAFKLNTTDGEMSVMMGIATR
jgi:predicted TPR repeat methyltransferase